MPKRKTIDLLGIGYCGWDTLCLVPCIPIDDKVQISRTLTQGGGPAATATVTAARLGLDGAFLGVVGDDTRSDAILQAFTDEGVCIDHIRRRSRAESAAAFCWIEEPTGKRSIAWTHGTAAQLGAEDVTPELVCSARALHLDGHQTQAAIHAAEIAQKNDIPVFLDAGTIVPGIGDVIALCTVVIASEAFAQTFTGLTDIEAAARHIRTLGPSWTGVTAGPAGSLGFDGQRVVHEGQYPVDVVDTTGAGDVYHGAFTARYVESIKAQQRPDLQACMRFATVVAGLKCRRLGGRTGIPNRTEVERHLQAK
ncbi:MAG: hypothetical protein HN742_21940 [Lentisphaerae bacterium]|jgi:sugar/nucleoside kinase (ribokinase family)|nr:hypothetical protein [Lentisphaerota bacterium]MBT4815982.1 hypothetical protein [Lentisphaerota bacterium]MBT5607321.1 hypothetical protein [Lentisphaerota bacterium]MBT7055361.1 hypothetical protein [Lentisphaerota bacterium]MBT7844555.1 hypothetical protein [Lentisphaerota bacterium]